MKSGDFDYYEEYHLLGWELKYLVEHSISKFVIVYPINPKQKAVKKFMSELAFLKTL